MPGYKCITTKKNNNSEYLTPIYIRIPDDIASQEMYDLFINYAKNYWEVSEDEKAIAMLLGEDDHQSPESYLREKLGSSDVSESCKNEIAGILNDRQKLLYFHYCASTSADIRGALD